jgi:hypothetical protein
MTAAAPGRTAPVDDLNKLLGCARLLVLRVLKSSVFKPREMSNPREITQVQKPGVTNAQKRFYTRQRRDAAD